MAEFTVNAEAVLTVEGRAVYDTETRSWTMEDVAVAGCEIDGVEVTLSPADKDALSDVLKGYEGKLIEAQQAEDEDDACERAEWRRGLWEDRA